MSKNCLDNVTNYANTENGIDIANALTAVYTYDFNAAQETLAVFDMSNILPGENITVLTVTVSDSGGTASATVANDMAVVDVSGLALSGVIRVDYHIETDQDRQADAPAVFIDITRDELTRGVSDPNRVPLREQTTNGGAPGGVCIYEHIQAVTSTSWAVAHNCGQERPASIQVYDASDNIMVTSWTAVDANNLTLDFFSAKAGRAFFIFKTI